MVRLNNKMVREITCPGERISTVARNIQLRNLIELISICFSEKDLKTDLEELLFYSGDVPDVEDFLQKVKASSDIREKSKLIEMLRSKACHNLRAHVLEGIGGYSIPETIPNINGEGCVFCLIDYKNWAYRTVNGIFNGFGYEKYLDKKVRECSDLESSLEIFDKAHLEILIGDSYRAKKPK